MLEMGAAIVSLPTWESGGIISAHDTAGGGEGDITDSGYGDIVLDIESGEPMPLSAGDSGVFGKTFRPDDCFFVALKISRLIFRLGSK